MTKQALRNRNYFYDHSKYHVKAYKSKKSWMFAGIFALALGGAAMTTGVSKPAHAASVNGQNADHVGNVDQQKEPQKSTLITSGHSDLSTGTVSKASDRASSANSFSPSASASSKLDDIQEVPQVKRRLKSNLPINNNLHGQSIHKKQNVGPSHVRHSQDGDPFYELNAPDNPSVWQAYAHQGSADNKGKQPKSSSSSNPQPSSSGYFPQPSDNDDGDIPTPTNSGTNPVIPIKPNSGSHQPNSNPQSMSSKSSQPSNSGQSSSQPSNGGDQPAKQPDNGQPDRKPNQPTKPNGNHGKPDNRRKPQRPNNDHRRPNTPNHGKTPVKPNQNNGNNQPNKKPARPNRNPQNGGNTKPNQNGNQPSNKNGNRPAPRPNDNSGKNNHQPNNGRKHPVTPNNRNGKRPNKNRKRPANGNGNQPNDNDRKRPVTPKKPNNDQPKKRPNQPNQNNGNGSGPQPAKRPSNGNSGGKTPNNQPNNGKQPQKPNHQSGSNGQPVNPRRRHGKLPVNPPNEQPESATLNYYDDNTYQTVPGGLITFNGQNGQTMPKQYYAEYLPEGYQIQPGFDLNTPLKYGSKDSTLNIPVFKKGEHINPQPNEPNDNGDQPKPNRPGQNDNPSGKQSQRAVIEYYDPQTGRPIKAVPVNGLHDDQVPSSEYLKDIPQGYHLLTGFDPKPEIPYSPEHPIVRIPVVKDQPHNPQQPRSSNEPARLNYYDPQTNRTVASVPLTGKNGSQVPNTDYQKNLPKGYQFAPSFDPNSKLTYGPNDPALTIPAVKTSQQPNNQKPSSKNEPARLNYYDPQTNQTIASVPLIGKNGSEVPSADYQKKLPKGYQFAPSFDPNSKLTYGPNDPALTIPVVKTGQQPSNQKTGSQNEPAYLKYYDPQTKQVITSIPLTGKDGSQVPNIDYQKNLPKGYRFASSFDPNSKLIYGPNGPTLDIPIVKASQPSNGQKTEQGYASLRYYDQGNGKTIKVVKFKGQNGHAVPVDSYTHAYLPVGYQIAAGFNLNTPMNYESNDPVLNVPVVPKPSPRSMGSSATPSNGGGQKASGNPASQSQNPSSSDHDSQVASLVDRVHSLESRLNSRSQSQPSSSSTESNTRSKSMPTSSNGAQQTSNRQPSSNQERSTSQNPNPVNSSQAQLRSSSQPNDQSGISSSNYGSETPNNSDNNGQTSTGNGTSTDATPDENSDDTRNTENNGFTDDDDLSNDPVVSNQGPDNSGQLPQTGENNSNHKNMKGIVLMALSLALAQLGQATERRRHD